MKHKRETSATLDLNQRSKYKERKLEQLEAERIKKEIKRNKSIFIYGPAQSKVPKRNNQYNYQLLIGSNSSKLLSEHLSKFEIYLSSLNKKISWHIDIDPLES